MAKHSMGPVETLVTVADANIAVIVLPKRALQFLQWPDDRAPRFCLFGGDGPPEQRTIVITIQDPATFDD